MTTPTNSNPAPARIDSGAAALWASALIILALVILQAGRLGAGKQALADVISVDDTVLLTAEVDSSEDILTLLDSRTDTLLVYAVVNRNTIELRETINLAELFQAARGPAGPGGRPRR